MTKVGEFERIVVFYIELQLVIVRKLFQTLRTIVNCIMYLQYLHITTYITVRF